MPGIGDRRHSTINSGQGTGTGHRRRGRDRMQETGQGQETGDGVPGIGNRAEGTRDRIQDTVPGIMDKIQETGH